MNNDTKAGLIAGAVLVPLGALGLLAIEAFSALILIQKGWVLSVLWDWFVVPFLGVRPLPTLYAVGLCLIYRLIVPYEPPAEPEGQTTADRLSKETARLLLPLSYLITGWLIRCWLG